MTNVILFLVGWMLASCAVGITIARGIAPTPKINLTHGKAYTND